MLPGINVVPYGKLYNVGGLSYVHGAYYNEACAKKQLIATNRNTVFGHTHTLNEYVKRSMVDDEPMVARTIGCLTDKDPKYRPGEPNSWVNAFHIAFFRRDGKYYEYVIRMLNDGSFHWNGKTYCGK